MLDERAERGGLLVGRSRETARIEGLLTAAEAGHGGALVLRGEAGVGKSALLEYAGGRASGFTVLRGGGVEGESGLAYAALHLILHPVLDGIERLPAPQSAALRGAFALSDAAVDERFGVALGCLGLMSEEAEKRPVLCLIDDAQWLDQASADALLFAARRLERERMLVVFAVRDPDDRGFVARGIPEAHLEALGSTAARELLAARLGAGVASGVIEWLVENANGNPLALLELPSTLTPQQLSGQHPLAGVVAPPTSVEELYLERVRQLAPATQRVLLVAACEGAGARASVEWALDALGLDVADLAPAEAAGLVRVDSEHITFRHPLVRTAVYRSAAFTDREQAHRTLASAAEAEGSPDRAAWHRAVATVGTDESVAAQLESTAERARVRSGHAAAAAALEAAAGLSEDETARARRLAAAAAAAWAAGLPDRATVLLDRAAPSVTDPVLSAEMDCLRGLVEWRCGVLTDACGTLVGGAARMAALDPTLTLDVLADAALASWDTGDYQSLAAAGAAVRALPEPADRQHQLLGRVLTGAVALSEGPGGGDLAEPDREPDVAEVLSACRAAADFDDARLLIWAAIAAELAGESSLETALLDRAASHARASGAVDRLIVTLESTTVQGFLAGNFTISAEANEGLRLAVETGLDNAASLFRACLAWLAAVRGDRGACRQYVAAALEVSVPHRHGIANAIADWALALLDLGTGRPDDAAERLQRMSSVELGLGHEFYELISAPDLVEAQVRSGRPESALATYEHFSRALGPGASDWFLSLGARCRALLTEGSAAESLFEEALTLHTGGNPFDRARTELLYGEHLRRERRRQDARSQLRSALRTFDLLGATVWAERAGVELRATGETARKRDPSAVNELTPQELQIARLVAEGGSNKDVAARLFLSPRTVEYHLRKVFSKLGIASRAELIRLGIGGAREVVTPGP